MSPLICTQCRRHAIGEILVRGRGLRDTMAVLYTLPYCAKHAPHHDHVMPECIRLINQPISATGAETN